MSQPDGTDAPPDDRTLRWLGRGVWLVLALGVLAFLVQGADNPADPVLVPPGSAEASSSPALPDPAPSLADTAATSTTSSQPTTADAVGTAPGSTTVPPATTSPGSGPAPTSPPPPPLPSPATVAQRRPLAGFGEVRFKVLGATGGAFDGTALLAVDQAAHQQGLMEQRDLRGYDGMIFRFEAPSTGEFYMRNTRISLSIAFFDVRGRFVSSTDMAPCPDRVRDCPTYPADAPYLHAIEVALGDLGRLGIGPGSVLSFPSP
ncbi:MAG: DUF192 domain-containing protein [Acidimicrobiales bacterium]